MLADRVRAGETLAAAARDAGLTVSQIENATRDGTNAGPEASLEFVERLFAKVEGNSEPIVAATPNGWVVAVLTDVTEAGNDAGDDLELERLRDQLSRAWSGDVAEAYRRALYGRHEININQQLLGSLFDQP